MTVLLPIRAVEKPWGTDRLPAPFTAPAGQRIGEIWFEPPATLPGLLVKYIFTSERLSVQVHPSDAQTRAAGLGRQGKEECWLVIAAEPGACLGVGLKAPLAADDLRAAASDGSIEQLLEWHPVGPGDFFYIPANTIHAIGAGVSLIEVQQNSDITYRLYDYGRPRELHLDAGIAVARGEPYPAQLHRRIAATGAVTLVDGPLFRLDRVDGRPAEAVAARYGDRPLLAIPVDGPILAGAQPVEPGACAVTRLAELSIAAGVRCLIAQDCI